MAVLILKAAVVVTVVELAVAVYNAGQSGEWHFAWYRVPKEFYYLLLTFLVWTIWQAVHPRSAARVTNSCRWQFITTWIANNKAVTWFALGVVLTVYATTALREGMLADNPTVQKWAKLINDHVFTFEFLGKQFDASKVLYLEFVGFLLGGGAWVIYQWQAPTALKPRPRSHQEALAATIREVGLDFPCGTFRSP